MGPEARLEAACMRLAKRHGWLGIKVYAEPGFPDRMFIGPRRQVVVVEFKAPRGRVTRKQEQWLEKLRKLRARCAVIRTVDAFKTALRIK